ncbi:MAG: hypothetical protein ACXVCV_22080, partial [Polyangia bacterium]
MAGQRDSVGGVSTQPLTPHAWQIPSQAVSQHCPPVQKPSPHAVAATQVPPSPTMPSLRVCTRG